VAQAQTQAQAWAVVQAAAADAAANAAANAEGEAEAAHAAARPTSAGQVLESGPGVLTPAWRRALCSACRLSVVSQ